jgi:acyl-CoA synthetase (AMP-forming)/AMP-acid ligase II
VDGLVGKIWGGTVKILQSGSTAHPPGDAEECPQGEPGHIWINTPALMKGYLGREDLTARVVSHGWFVTGDIGFLDDDGFLHLSGREREEINKGGMKVHPTDIDMVVERFEHTVDVCAFAYEDALQGRISASPSCSSRTPPKPGAVINGRCSTRQPRLPRRWYVIDAIPRSSRQGQSRGIAQSCTCSPVGFAHPLHSAGNGVGIRVAWPTRSRVPLKRSCLR